MIILLGSLFTIVLSFIFSLLCGADFGVFVDYPSLVVITLPLIFFLLVTRSGRSLRDYIKSSFSSNYIYSQAELNTLVTAVKNTIRLVLASGCLGFFAGIIVMLNTLSDPSMIGPFLAVSLITSFYGIAISYFIFFPVQAWAEHKLSTLDK